MKHLFTSLVLIISISTLNAFAAPKKEAAPVKPKKDYVLDTSIDEADLEPIRLISNYLVMQEKLILDELPPQVNLKDELKRIGSRFMEVPPEVWRNRRNAEAMLIYLISGGNPATLRDLVGNGVVIAMDTRMLTGALAYSERNNEIALSLLTEFDHRKLPLTIAAHIALLKATLVAKTNPYDALALYDDVRLLAPGTLLEEAALRREAFLAVNAKNRNLFYQLSSQYFNRYNKSKYNKIFEDHFTSYIASFKDDARQKEFEKIVEAIAILPKERREHIYRLTARHSIANGNLRYARLATAEAVSIFQEASPHYHQLRLYEAASKMFLDLENLQLATETLLDIPAYQLDVEDTLLRNATLKLAKEIIQTPKQAALPPDPSKMEKEELAKNYQMLDYINQIEEKLKTTDDIFKKTLR